MCQVWCSNIVFLQSPSPYTNNTTHTNTIKYNNQNKMTKVTSELKQNCQISNQSESRTKNFI